jgi:hypothetical protein
MAGERNAGEFVVGGGRKDLFHKMKSQSQSTSIKSEGFTHPRAMATLVHARWIAVAM